jgi:thioredoxin reductase/NAD-dependent dihydropyrimidine dehydrogenase PreA subunit
MSVSLQSIWTRIPIVGGYFSWLDNDAPAGEIERFPAVDESGESEVPGVYIAGDLTGIPLLKLAAKGGFAIVDGLASDSVFSSEQVNRPTDDYDLIIVGAGVAGLSAALSAKKAGFKYVVLEADRTFSTIRNFPAKKPILAHPLDMEQLSALTIEGDDKEELLANLEGHLEGGDLSVHLGKSVVSINGEKGAFTVHTRDASFSGLRVLLAIGKSGESRSLGALGEDRPKVLNRLIDPADFRGKRILVVGGGDSALENALLLTQQDGTQVALSYRGETFTRPKPENIRQIEKAQQTGKLKVFFGSTVREVRESGVVLKTGTEEEMELGNDIVFTMIGTRLPTELLGKAGIGVEGAWTTQKKVLLATLLFFAGMIYFGKSSGSIAGESFFDAFAAAPSLFMKSSWDKAVLGGLGWLSLVGFTVTGLFALGVIAKRIKRTLNLDWSSFKTFYFLGVGILMAWVYICDVYLGSPLAGRGLGFWYTLLYSATILIFGLRRMAVRRNNYITAQTTTLIVVQILFLFLLPEFILPVLGENQLIGDWAMKNLFPGGSYWRSYGFVLAWPLFFSNLLYGQPTTAWLVLSLLQTFLIIPFFVWRFGKGAYCGWICSCGGLAETLGDEYRDLAPHGKRARSLEHVGQVILAVVLLMTVWNLVSPSWMGEALSNSRKVYKIVVDVGLAGVVGVGAYFFFSGRVWCRFFCPLAALMHIYTRFSVFRIFSDKKKCISCGLCTRVCHMGIDVMGYANKGRPMDNYECVRCSSCIHSCPVSCLEFGTINSNENKSSGVGGSGSS